MPRTFNNWSAPWEHRRIDHLIPAIVTLDGNPLLCASSLLVGMNSAMCLFVALRLANTRQLIELTDMSIMDVALARGSVPSSHFPKTIRDHFEMLPSELRMQNRA